MLYNRCTGASLYAITLEYFQFRTDGLLNIEQSLCVMSFCVGTE